MASRTAFLQATLNTDRFQTTMTLIVGRGRRGGVLAAKSTSVDDINHHPSLDDLVFSEERLHSILVPPICSITIALISIILLVALSV